MKKAAVLTTTARGAAVSRSSATAVQSVYIASGTQPLPILAGEPMVLPASDTNGWCARWSRASRRLRQLPLLLGVALLLAAPLAAPSPVRAGLEFDNCQPTADGGVTCDTRPTGNTRADDEAARYGLFDEASPGWSEFDPYEGYDDMFGGNWT